MTWDAVFDTLATAMDRRSQHDEWTARVAAGVENVRAAAAGTSVAVVSPSDDGTLIINGPAYDTSALLVEAGVEVQTIDNPTEDFGNDVLVVSGERLGDVVAENIVVVTYEEDPAQRSNLLETNPPLRHPSPAPSPASTDRWRSPSRCPA